MVPGFNSETSESEESEESLNIGPQQQFRKLYGC